MLYPEPFTIDNFLTPAELEYFDDVIADSEKYGYFWQDGSLMVKGDPILKNIEKRLYDLFQVTDGYVDIGGMIQKADVGEGLVYHYDEYSPMGDIKSTNYGVAIYLNDDFTGGELHYQFLDVKVKPMRGMLAAHPGSKEFTHGVIDVISGTRYSISAFIHSVV